MIELGHTTHLLVASENVATFATYDSKLEILFPKVKVKNECDYEKSFLTGTSKEPDTHVLVKKGFGYNLYYAYLSGSSVHKKHFGEQSSLLDITVGYL